jgi:long-chain-fatty-acid--CoA ligase ACSBG
MRGRNICMGYFKNAEDTSKTIDSQGFLHSGDVGKLTKEGVLFITGRVKELIITAGGENIPPILIENEIKKALPCLSNVMVVGDFRKYLTCLISLK